MRVSFYSEEVKVLEDIIKLIVSFYVFDQHYCKLKVQASYYSEEIRVLKVPTGF